MSNQTKGLLAREELFKLAAASPLGLYVLGLLSVQAHLLRYGIFDASLLEFYYIVVGGWLVMSLAPAIAALGVVAVATFGRRRKTDSRTVAWFRRPAALIGGSVLLISFLLWALNYSALSMAVNFNCYPFPIDYLVFNLAFGNLFLAGVGVLAIRLGRTSARVREVVAASVVVCLAFLAVYGLVFGRTIYPAIDPGFGGGAPQLGKIALQGRGEPTPAILLFASKTGRYYLELEHLPNGVEERTGYDFYLRMKQNPVFKATFHGPVQFAPNSMIKALTIFAPKQPEQYRKEIERRLTRG